MAPTRSTQAASRTGEQDVRDAAPAAAQKEGETQAVRNLFDLRVIIGGLFTLYGIYLTIHGILDGQEAVDKAAGVRINLWAGLGMLAMAGCFLLWAWLRPLTLDRIVDAQADSVDLEEESDRINRERAQFTTDEHRARDGRRPPH
jgi:hypothetical protein